MYRIFVRDCRHFVRLVQILRQCENCSLMIDFPASEIREWEDIVTSFSPISLDPAQKSFSSDDDMPYNRDE